MHNEMCHFSLVEVEGVVNDLTNVMPIPVHVHVHVHAWYNMYYIICTLCSLLYFECMIRYHTAMLGDEQ